MKNIMWVNSGYLESQPYPGLCQKQHGQQKLILPLYSPLPGETPHGMLCTVLVSPTKEERGTVRTSWEEGQKVERNTAHSLWRQAAKIGAVKSGEEKVVWKSHSYFTSGGYREAWEGLFIRNGSDRTMSNWCKLKEEKFMLNLGKNLYCKAGKILEQVAQGGCRCPSPGSVVGQVG